ncbi:hypothetical protein IID20_00585 [Patescibacteria group bacterium]|nr:hypothetical protein [Patescibacteria group bacterium]
MRLKKRQEKTIHAVSSIIFQVIGIACIIASTLISKFIPLSVSMIVLMGWAILYLGPKILKYELTDETEMQEKRRKKREKEVEEFKKRCGRPIN